VPRLIGGLFVFPVKVLNSTFEIAARVRIVDTVGSVTTNDPCLKLPDRKDYAAEDVGKILVEPSLQFDCFLRRTIFVCIEENQHCSAAGYVCRRYVSRMLKAVTLYQLPPPLTHGPGNYQFGRKPLNEYAHCIDIAIPFHNRSQRRIQRMPSQRVPSATNCFFRSAGSGSNWSRRSNSPAVAR
jgi:hypothetical protein